MEMLTKFAAAVLTVAPLFSATADTVLVLSPSAIGAQATEAVPTDVSSPATGDFTWEAWFKASDLTLAENRMAAQTGWAWNDPGRLMLAIRTHKNNPAPNEPAIEAFYYNGGNKRLIGSTAVTGGWHHAALVRSGTTISLYLDGVFETNATDYVNATPGGAATAPFLIGPAFHGSLAEVRLWNVARMAAEIAASKDTRLAGTESNLLGYWPLDEGTAPVTPTNIVTGVAAAPVSYGGNTVGYNQGAGTAAYADDAGLTLASVPVAGTVYTTTAAGGKWSEIAWTPSTPVSGSGARIVLAGAGDFEKLYARCSDVNFAPVYFGFDSAVVPQEELGKIDAVSQHLADNANRVVVVEGNCDERGSNEYNMSLGENRAIIIRNYLVNNGVSADRIQTRSYGEERPAVEGQGEGAWAKNRRGEFAIFQK